MSTEFRRRQVDDDSVNYESVCTNCFQKVFGYTTSVLEEKERSHKCLASVLESHWRRTQELSRNPTE
jgi:hypothetical protein